MSLVRFLAISAFTLAAMLGIVVEVAARRGNSRIPTLAAICGFVMQYRAGRMPVGRIAIYGFWWWLGWHFFAR
jgi:hypothetical protein